MHIATLHTKKAISRTSLSSSFQLAALIYTIMQSVCPRAQASSMTLVNRIKVTQRKSTVCKHRTSYALDETV